MDARRRNKHATVAIPFALIQSGCSWKCILLICKVFLLAHLSVWRGLVYAWLLMAKLQYKTQTKSTLKGSLNLNRSSNSAIVAVFYHLWDGKQIDYFDVACFAVHHCIALFCFKTPKATSKNNWARRLPPKVRVSVYPRRNVQNWIVFHPTSSLLLLVNRQSSLQRVKLQIRAAIGTWKKTSLVASSDAPELLSVFMLNVVKIWR